MTKVLRAFVCSAVSYPVSVIRVMMPSDHTLLIEKHNVLAARRLEAGMEPFVPRDLTTVWEVEGQRLVDDTRPIRVGGGQTAVLWVFCREPERIWFWSTLAGRFVE